jgi:diacylglycerol O-acyltransferase / wax synthase
VPERLSAVDASFLYLEERSVVMHIGSVMVLERPPDDVDAGDLARLIGARVAYIPRYRQRVRTVPGHLGNPVWVDDERFDLDLHVRRTALPRPGTRDQLTELVARVQPRRLDRSRPLWEVYLVEGLEDGGLAIITKTHQAMVDGRSAVDLGQVLWDDAPGSAATPAPTFRPAPEPTLVELVTGAVVDAVRRPPQVLETLRTGLGDARAGLRRAAGAASGLARAASTAPAGSGGPLEVEVGEQRRYAVVDTALEDYRRVRRAVREGAVPGAELHDVVLAVLAGALRSWMLSRGLPLGPASAVRALVPLSVAAEEDDDAPRPAGAVPPQVEGHLVDLPVGEPDPVVRLQQVVFSARRGEQRRRVGARELAGIAGFAPPTLHSLGVRVAGQVAHRLFTLVVTDVPGPQHPLYVGPVRMTGSYPVIPLLAGHALAVGVNSYDGAVTFGLNADRDALPDLAVLAECVPEALAALLDAADGRR